MIQLQHLPKASILHGGILDETGPFGNRLHYCYEAREIPLYLIYASYSLALEAYNWAVWVFGSEAWSLRRYHAGTHSECLRILREWVERTPGSRVCLSECIIRGRTRPLMLAR